MEIISLDMHCNFVEIVQKHFIYYMINTHLFSSRLENMEDTIKTYN